MSLSALSLGNLTESIADQSTTAAPSTTLTASPATTAPSGSFGLVGASDPASSIATTTSSLLQALSSGNVTGAQADVATLQNDLQNQVAATLAQDSSSSATPTPLDSLLNSIGNSLGAGNTSGALADLSSYLTQTGNASGNLISTSA